MSVPRAATDGKEEGGRHAGNGVAPEQGRYEDAPTDREETPEEREARHRRNDARLGSGPGAGRPEAPPAAAPAPDTGVAIILDYLRARYRPDFRRGNAIHCADGREVPMGEACSVPTSPLIDRLAGAADAPRYQGGGVKHHSLPGFFKTWAKVAWGDLLAALPEEDEAEFGQDAPAAEEFRRLVREAMLSEVVLGDIIGKGGVCQTERRSLIEWCNRFARVGPWRSIRSKKCWTKFRQGPAEGEVTLMVALRHEVFSQLKADRRLCDMGPKKFARRAARYGVGSSTRDDRPHGLSAIVLDPKLVADLVADLPDDDPAEASPQRDRVMRPHTIGTRIVCEDQITKSHQLTEGEGIASIQNPPEFGHPAAEVVGDFGTTNFSAEPDGADAAGLDDPGQGRPFDPILDDPGGPHRYGE